MALKADGSIVVWGSNGSGQYDIPTPNAGYRAIAGSGGFRCGLRLAGTGIDQGGIAYMAMLRQNYPNPFNPATTIAFHLPAETAVGLAVFDLSGHLVRELAHGTPFSAGPHAVYWNGRDDAGRDLPSGIYLCRLHALERRESRKLTLVR